jgi:hypothetical protein
VLSTGYISDLFPKASKGGIDASAGVAYLLAPSWEASLELGYTRFFYTLNPAPGDTYVAGGALDEMGKLSVGATYLFR